MKCKGTIVKIFAAFLFGIAAINFTTSGMDSAVTHSELERNPFSCFPRHSTAAPSEIYHLSDNHPDSELMARLFQLMFILFFISPPIIALMLFLIWKELKAKNKLK